MLSGQKSKCHSLLPRFYSPRLDYITFHLHLHAVLLLYHHNPYIDSIQGTPYLLIVVFSSAASRAGAAARLQESTDTSMWVGWSVFQLTHRSASQRKILKWVLTTSPGFLWKPLNTFHLRCSLRCQCSEKKLWSTPRCGIQQEPALCPIIYPHLHTLSDKLVSSPMSSGPFGFTLARALHDHSSARKQGVGQLPPEKRLVHAVYGTWFMPLAVFWQCWTSILAPDGSPWPAHRWCLFRIGILSCFISSYRPFPLCTLR